MGVQRGAGSIYYGPYGTVYWLSLANRSALHPQTLARAASLRDVTHLLTDINNPHIPFPAEIAWGEYANLRVVAWNGGSADFK